MLDKPWTAIVAISMPYSLLDLQWNGKDAPLILVVLSSSVLVSAFWRGNIVNKFNWEGPYVFLQRNTSSGAQKLEIWKAARKTFLQALF